MKLSLMQILFLLVNLNCLLSLSQETTNLNEIGNEIFTNTSYAIIALNGTVAKASLFIASDYVPIKELQKFEIPVVISPANVVGIAFYDEKKSFLSGIQFPYHKTTYFAHLKYISPPKTAYFRTTYKQSTSAPKFNLTLYDSTKPTANYDIFQMASPNINRNSRLLRISLDFGNGILIGHAGVNKNDGDVYLVRSEDYGFSWQVMGNGKDIGLLEGLYYGDHDGQGMAIIGNGDYSRHNLLKVTNYGKTWKTDYKIILSNTDVKNFVPSSNGIENVKYCGHKTWRAFINSMTEPTNSVVIESNDDGLTWDFTINKHKGEILNPLKASFRAMTKMSDGSLWGVGMHPSNHIGLWKSTDDGLIWERKTKFQAFQSIEEFDGVYYAGALGEGYRSSLIYISKDFGETWKKVFEYTLEDDITYHRFFVNLNGTIIAGMGSGEGTTTTIKHFHFLVSQDKGETWKDYGERPSDKLKIPYIADPIYQQGRAIVSSSNGLYTF